MSGSSRFRVSVHLKAVTLPQRPAPYQRVRIEGSAAFETLALQDGIHLDLFDDVSLSAQPGSDPVISIRVEADDRDQAWNNARPILENLVAGLTLAFGRPLGKFEESDVFIVPDPHPKPGLVAAQSPTLTISTSVSDQQLVAALDEVSYRGLIQSAIDRDRNLDQALRWFHLASSLEDPRMSYIACWVGIEVLTEGILKTGKDHVNETNIRQAFQDSGITGKDDSIRRLWRLRGAIVHKGEEPTGQELAEVRKHTRDFIIRNGGHHGGQQTSESVRA